MGRREREHLRERLQRIQPELVERIVTAVHREVPAYQALHQSQLAEVRAIATWVVVRFLGMWVEGTGLGPADLERVRGIGRARAADGRSIAAVTRAHRVGAAAAARVIGEHAEDLTVEDALALNLLSLTMIDQISEALSSGHSEAADRMDADLERARRVFFDDLLTGRHASQGAIRDRSRALELSPPDPAMLLVAETTGRSAEASASAVAMSAGMELLSRVRPSRAGGSDALLTTRSNRVVLLLPPAAVKRITAEVEGGGWRGCLLAARPLTAMPDAYRLASDALDTAPGHAFGSTGLLRDADACVLGLLNAGSAEPRAVRREVLGPLLEPANRHLLSTLDAYFRTGSAAAAAASLHVHPQTLRYRLRRVRDLTGHDLGDPWQRFTLELACAIAARDPNPLVTG